MANSPDAQAKRAGARVVFEDPSWAQGFTQIPNPLVWARGVDPDAKMVLITIMSYAFLPTEDLPDQEEMAAGLNRSPRWLWQQLKDLQQRNILIVHRHGQGQPNDYTIRKMSEWNLDSQACAKQGDSQACANQESQPSATGIRNRLRILTSNKEVTKKKEELGTEASASPAPPSSKPKRRIKPEITDEEREQREEFLGVFYHGIHTFSESQTPGYRAMALKGIREHTFPEMMGCVRAMTAAARFTKDTRINPTVVANNVLLWQDANRPRRWQEVEAWASRKAERQAGR